jgi:hypothetical protein
MWLTDQTFLRRRPEVAPEGFLHQVAAGAAPPIAAE